MLKKEKTKRLKFLKDELMSWRDYFCLTGWEITVGITTNEKNQAQIDWDTVALQAEFEYSEAWLYRERVTRKDISRTAFHEMCELFLNSQFDLICREYGFNKAQHSTHQIIRFLENTLFLEVYKGPKK